MEKLSTEDLMPPKQRKTAAASSSSYRSPFDLIAGAISAVLEHLNLKPCYWPFSKEQEDSTKETRSVSEPGRRTFEAVAVESKAVRGRRPKDPTTSSGRDPQHH